MPALILAALQIAAVWIIQRIIVGVGVGVGSGVGVGVGIGIGVGSGAGLLARTVKAVSLPAFCFM